MRETDLYAPVKALLEGQGYDVKAEVGAADIVAIRGDEPPVIVELKTGFSLTLLHQAIERQRVTDDVYVAVPRWKGRAGWKAFRANRKLCRRLGLGVILVNSDGSAEAVEDPGPYQPRKSSVRRGRLLKEFQHRVGDPNEGGSTRKTIITHYRQDALRCLVFIAEHGPTKASDVAAATKVARARNIMADDHYGWFERESRGVYAITPKGIAALETFKSEIASLP